MSEKPILSVITATLGTFSDYWLQHLLQVRGKVQFVIVYPPGATLPIIADTRIKFLISPFKGEVMQRFTGLLNADGDYLLALDDDDFLHPDILKATTDYFKIFPDSWIFRLYKEDIDYLDTYRLHQDWEELPDILKLGISRKTPENRYPYQGGNYKELLEIPIAPLEKTFDIRHLIWPFLERKDMNGLHFENFNNIIWQRDRVIETLTDLSQTMRILGNITWLPSWSLDRLLGLFVQAKFYKKGLIIGHAMPKPEQIRYTVRPPSIKQTRFYFSSDALLAKRFPQYGYFWNLFFKLFYDMPRVLVKALKIKTSPKQNG